MMKRWLLGLVLCVTFSGSAIAQLSFVEGTDYQLISPAVNTTQPDKVVVTEVFW